MSTRFLSGEKNERTRESSIVLNWESLSGSLGDPCKRKKKKCRARTFGLLTWHVAQISHVGNRACNNQ